MKKMRILALIMTCAMLLSSLMIIPVSAEAALPVAANVNGKKVVIDGVRDPSEGWSATPTFTTQYKVSDPAYVFKDTNSDGILDTPYTDYSASGGVEAITPDTNPSSLYISTDGKYIYFYYESTHFDFINSYGGPDYAWAQVLNWEGNKTWAASALGISLAPADKANEESSVADHEGFFLKLATFPNDSYANNVVETSLTTNGGTYVWDHKLGDENKQANGGAWDASQNWASRYFVRSFRNAQKAAASGTDVTAEDYGKAVRDDTHIAMRVEGGTHGHYEKLCVEIAFPISDTLAKQLQTGSVDYRIATYEQSNRFNESTVMRKSVSATDGLVENAGYVLSGRTYSYTGEKVGEITYNNWSFPATCGVKFTLPQVGTTAPVIAGFQSRVNNDGTYDVRFVSVVDDYTGFTLENSKLGYIFGYGSATNTQLCKKVYTELNVAGGDPIKASDFGGKYFFCFTITGLEQNEEIDYTFDVTCFTKKDDSSDAVTCVNPVKVTVSWDGAKVNFTY